MTATDPGMDVVPAHHETAMVIYGRTPEEILEHAGHVAERLKDVIESQGLSVSVGRDRKHVEVGGWQAAGAMLGALGGQALHAETDFCRRVWDERESDEIAYEARVEVKTLDGRIAGAAEALCSSAERNWRGRDEFAIKSMAETRAESRAYRRAIGWVVSMAGYSPTPAEEMRAESTVSAGGPAGSAPLPDWAAHMSDASIPLVAQNLTRVLQAAGIADPAARVAAIGQEIFDLCDGGFPFALARLAKLLADTVEKETRSVADAADQLRDEVDGDAVDTTNEKEEEDA